MSKRPSPAMVVALVALFVSLGGVSYGVATGSIDSREVKNGSLRGKDLKRNTLTGTRIKESSLRRVKRAVRADRLGDRRAVDLLTRGFTGVKQGEVGFTGNYTPIAHLALPKGAFVILAKTEVSSTASAPVAGVCRLRAGADEDASRAQLIASGIGANPRQTVTMTVPHIDEGDFTVRLECKAEGDPGLNLFRNPPFTQAGRIRLTAIRTDSLESQVQR